MRIEHIVVKKHKIHGREIKKVIDLYAYATALWNELNEHGFINRLKDIPQLGNIQVPKAIQNSRYDYVMLQLYLHQFTRKNLNRELEYSYNNTMLQKEFPNSNSWNALDKDPTMGDLLQVFVIAYNLGHFINTFTASRAVVIIAYKNPLFRQIVLNSLEEDTHRQFADRMIETQDYQRFHLINGLAILQKCDKNNPGVMLAINLLTEYIAAGFNNKNTQKLTFVFDMFRRIRDVAYISFDLVVAPVPLIIDLADEKSLKLFLRELLSQYNNRSQMYNLVEAIQKLLDDTVYNEKSYGLIDYTISQQMVKSILPSLQEKDYINDFVIDRHNSFNKKYYKKNDFDGNNVLKLTFSVNDGLDFFKIIQRLSKMDYVKVGYYDRNHGYEKTILVSILKRCSRKQIVAMRILKFFVSEMQGCANISNSDDRYLITTKFFLYYLFNEHRINMVSTIDENICLLVERGRKARIKCLEHLLHKNTDIIPDQKHEAEFILELLRQDTRNDTTIVVCCSILVFDKLKPDQKLCEFDGLIIHPNRKKII